MKNKYRLYANGGMQKWAINYWETYAPVVTCIILMSLVVISSIYEFTSRSIDFVPAFNQADLDIYILMNTPLGMRVDENRG